MGSCDGPFVLQVEGTCVRSRRAAADITTRSMRHAAAGVKFQGVAGGIPPLDRGVRGVLFCSRPGPIVLLSVFGPNRLVRLVKRIGRLTGEHGKPPFLPQSAAAGGRLGKEGGFPVLAR